MRNGVLFSFSSRKGEVVNRQIIATGRLFDTVYHVKWEDGEETDRVLYSTYKDGDKVALVFYGKKNIAADVNLTTTYFKAQELEFMTTLSIVLFVIGSIFYLPCFAVLLISHWNFIGTIGVIFYVLLFSYNIARRKIFDKQVRKYINTL